MAEEQTQETSEQTSATKPDGLPDDLWDAEKAAPRVDALVPKFLELSKFQTETAERLSKRPEAADKYEAKLPKDFELPAGVEFAFDADSELLKTAREFAFASGMDQAGFEGLVGQYVDEMLGRSASQVQKAEEATRAEMAKLGANAQPRIDAVNAWIDANFAGDEAAALKGGATSAAAVTAIEKLIEKAGGPKAAITADGGRGAALGEAELISMQNDPRYWRDKDPAFIAKVTEGWKRLYPGQVDATGRTGL